MQVLVKAGRLHKEELNEGPLHITIVLSTRKVAPSPQNTRMLLVIILLRVIRFDQKGSNWSSAAMATRRLHWPPLQAVGLALHPCLVYLRPFSIQPTLLMCKRGEKPILIQMRR